MENKDFEQSNKIIGKPREWKDEECYSVPALIGEIIVGDKKCQSYTTHWVPTPAELERLNKGEGFYLTIINEYMTPVSLSMDLPDVNTKGSDGINPDDLAHMGWVMGSIPVPAVWQQPQIKYLLSKGYNLVSLVDWYDKKYKPNVN